VTGSGSPFFTGDSPGSVFTLIATRLAVPDDEEFDGAGDAAATDGGAEEAASENGGVPGIAAATTMLLGRCHFRESRAKMATES
jgi:hypothetical protein